MLDLKKLEEKLDEALAKETSESLTTWLLQKRQLAYQQFLGLGTIKDKFSINSGIFFKTQKVDFKIQFNEISIFQGYPIAA